MKIIFSVILLATVSYAFSQDWPLRKMVSDQKARKTAFVKIPAFSFSADKQMAGRGNYQQLRLDASFTRQLMAQRPGAIQISIPVSSSQSITCELVKYDLGNIKFTENNSQVIPNVRIPATYRGIVSGEQQTNTVILTVTDDYISLIACFADKVIQITKANETEPLTYRLYNSRQVPFPQANFDCGTTGTGTSRTMNGIRLDGTINKTNDVQDKCVNVFVDCFDSLYQWRGSNQQQTINYVYELFNFVATGYFTELINVQVVGINVWTTTDPYRQDTKENSLTDLADHYKDDFWGNICIGLDYSTVGKGGLAYLGAVKAVTPNSCPVYNAGTGAFGYCDMNYSGSLQNFPTGPNVTQGPVKVTMHEIGHLLGANHTHWCGWQLTPTTTGAIDNCAPVEGTCAAGPPPPATGGTIMSYCQLSSTSSVNFSNGFGLLPGNAIRNFVNNTACIPACTACQIGKVDRKITDKHSPLLRFAENITTQIQTSAAPVNNLPAPSLATGKTWAVSANHSAGSFRKPDETTILSPKPAK